MTEIIGDSCCFSDLSNLQFHRLKTLWKNVESILLFPTLNIAITNSLLCNQGQGIFCSSMTPLYCVSGLLSIGLPTAPVLPRLSRPAQ